MWQQKQSSCAFSQITYLISHVTCLNNSLNLIWSNTWMVYEGNNKISLHFSHKLKCQLTIGQNKTQ